MSKLYSLALLFLIYAFRAHGQHLYVNLNATGANDGTSWANAYANFQTAIDAAASGDSIFVAQATYQPVSETSFVMKEGVKIFGGFLGTETGFSQRNLAHKATLHGNGASVILNKNNGLTSSATLDGFIITGGSFTTIGSGSSAGAGGGINNIGSSPTITNCFFSGNTGVFGGGMSNSASSPTITNCTFSGNNAGYGAGIYNELSSTPTITNCIFSGNTTISTGGGGAGMCNLACSPTIVNCIFSANNAAGSSNIGGGMTNYFASPNIVNCTIWSNTATNSGGGMANINGSNPAITNCIIGSNTAGTSDPGISNVSNSTPVISYSDVQGGLAAGVGNIYADPLFTDAANGNYTLKSGSPCINAGNNAANTTTTDLAGKSRISGSTIDMGAHEYRTTRGYVKLGATGANNGTSWTDAYTNFQTAIDAAVSGDSIFVAQASYQPASGTSFVMKEGVKIFGGFVGTESDFNQRNLAYKATLQGNGSRVITNDNNGLTVAAVLDGFIVTGGNAQHGGGMYNYFSSPTIINCTFTDNNITSGFGGGVANFYASPVFMNCVFSKNRETQRAGGGGGGMGNTSSSPVITNCTFSGNHASLGGAIRNLSSSLAITNTIIWGNTSNNGNAGINDNFASPSIITYSDIQDGVISGTGNISADPKFVNAPGEDYSLLSCSPAVNAGNNAANSATTDLDGTPRIYEGTVDMGAYELQAAATVPTLFLSNKQITTSLPTNSSLTFDENCNVLASLQSMGDSPVTGEVTAKVWIEDSQPAHYVRRHYEITPVDGAATATGKVTLYFTQEDFNAFNLVNPTAPLPGNLLIEKRAGTSSDNTGLPNSYPGTPETLSDVETVWNGTAQRWEVSFEVAGFSGFFVKTSEAPLPVSWISISARRNDASQVVLDWRVDERAVSHYQVERSLNARNFVPAGTLTARGDGTTEYTFTDPTPVLQRAYYRIRQTDLDGSYSYSRMLSIAGMEETELTAFPNPASGIVTVQMEQRYIGSRLRLVNKSGIVIEEIMVKGQTITLDLGKHAPGVYLLSTADGRVMKLVRQ